MSPGSQGPYRTIAPRPEEPPETLTDPAVIWTGASFAIEPFARIDVSAVRDWVSAIPFERWPQQHRLADGALRPAMVNDLYWEGFGHRTDALVAGLMLAVTSKIPACSLPEGRVAGPSVMPLAEDHNRMLSVVMPGHAIPEHIDAQEPEWLARVHVPLLSNARAVMTMAGEEHVLEVGLAYLVNTRAPHAIRNDGRTPRVHFMFDVRKP